MSDTRRIILVHRTLTNRNGCDPAVNLSAPGIDALLTAYARSRSDEDRAAIPLHPGARPAEFTIRRVNQAAMRFIQRGETPTERAQSAVQVGCHHFVDESGAEHNAKITAGDAFGYADLSWLDEIADAFGSSAVLEIGAAIIQWSEARKGALAPFGSVPGLVLAR